MKVESTALLLHKRRKGLDNFSTSQLHVVKLTSMVPWSVIVIELCILFYKYRIVRFLQAKL